MQQGSKLPEISKKCTIREKLATANNVIKQLEHENLLHATTIAEMKGGEIALDLCAAENERLKKSHELLMMFVKDGYKSLHGKVSKKTGIALFNYVNADTELSYLVDNSDYNGILQYKINNQGKQNENINQAHINSFRAGRLFCRIYGR